MSVQYTGACAVHRGCSVHWGISLSTPEGVQYTGDIIEYNMGCSVHCGNIMSTARGYHDECGRIS